jgi:3'-5' exoribonuclease 1
MNFIIFDLEATCWETEREAAGKTQEIIEIGAVKIDENGEIIDTFGEFIRPIVHSQLSNFCTKLTTITQVDVNRASLFIDVIEKFKTWIGLYDNEDYLLCSWGFFDQRALMRNCDYHKLESNWTKSHINLKEQYPKIIGTYRSIGLKKAVELEKFEWEGVHHRGISDAINLAKIFNKYITQWAY